MRPLLGTTIMMLLLAGLIFLGENRTDTSDRSPLDLVVFSKGSVLPVGSHPLVERYGVYDGIIAGDLVLRWASHTLGMRVASFNKGFTLEANRNYAVSQSSRDLEALIDFCRSRPVNSLLVLHHLGNPHPGPDIPFERFEALRETIRTIGAQHGPWQHGSWCLIALRRPGGWAVLAESFAAGQAAALAFSVSPDFNLYDRYSGDRIEDFSMPETPVGLLDELPLAEIEARHWVQPITYKDRTLPALATLLPAGASENPSTGSFTWRQAYLWPGSELECALAVQPPPKGTAGAATFSLTVDGQEIASRLLSSQESGEWFDWRVDLSRFSGQRVDLTLGLRSDQGGLIVYWGRPLLSRRDSP